MTSVGDLVRAGYLAALCLGPPALAEDGPATVAVSWRSALGAISVDGILYAPAEGTETTTRNVPVPAAGDLAAALDDNPDCRVSIDAGALAGPVTALEFPCRAVALTAPFPVPLPAICGGGSAAAARCVLAADAEAFSMELPGWRTIEAPVTAGRVMLSPADFVPAVDLDALAGALAEGRAAACEGSPVAVDLVGLCRAGACEPDLAPDAAALPDLVRLGLYRVEGGAREALGEVELPIAGATAEALLAAFPPRAAIAIELNVPAGGYGAGREVRFYAGPDCDRPLDVPPVDLGNPGNRLPEVPPCGYFRVSDDGEPRSACIAYGEPRAAAPVAIDVPVSPCPFPRIAVLIVEHRSMNGAMGNAVAAALDAHVAATRAGGSCAPVDIAHAVGPAARILLSAEDVHFGSGQAGGALAFANSESDPVRDFGWVDRTWAGRLGGVLVIVDGRQANVSDMVQSPATMAWEIRKVFRRVIDVSDTDNCAALREVLLFRDCAHVETPAAFAAQFAAYLADAGAALERSEQP